MKSTTHVLLLALLLCVALTSRISSVWAKPQGGNSQNRVVGEVVKTDQTTKRLTIKTATGEIEVLAGDTAVLLRVPPGEASADKASKISFGEIEIGDRAFARVGAAEEGKTLQATQVVVTSRSASERGPKSGIQGQRYRWSDHRNKSANKTYESRHSHRQSDVAVVWTIKHDRWGIRFRRRESSGRQPACGNSAEICHL